MGQLRIMNQRGDSPMPWPDTIEEQQTEQGQADTLTVKEKFDELMSNNFFAYKVEEPGADAEQIRSFDPSAREIVITPPLAGGSA